MEDDYTIELNKPLTREEKKYIAKQIKNISFDLVESEMNVLIDIGKSKKIPIKNSRIGNNVVDYFTYYQRLHTKGKYNVHFFSFLENWDFFKQKKYIQNLLLFYKKKNKKNQYLVYKEIFNLSICTINIIKPLVYMDIFIKYQPHSILDFCAGWGGAMIAAASCSPSPTYLGIEINTELKEPYEQIISYLKKKTPNANVNILFKDALLIDYSTIYYDFVFTSPPYYFIQKYENNIVYSSKKEMNEFFYQPLFTKTFDGLQMGGIYAINVCKEVFESVLIPLFGYPCEIFPYKKSQRQNKYQELVYVWKKK
jgi:hypothetical protein